MISKKTIYYLTLALLICQSSLYARRSYGRSQGTQQQRQYRPAAHQNLQNQYPQQACEQQLQADQQYGAYTGDEQAAQATVPADYSMSGAQAMQAPDYGAMGGQHGAMQASTGGSLQEITSDSELQSILNSPEHTILYITASWCEACKFMEPVINAAADKYGDRIIFRKIDYEKFKKQADKLGVDGLPRTLLRQNGKQITVKGSRPETYFMGQVEQFLRGTLKPEVDSVVSPARSRNKK